jgi:adhesin/invasin
MLSALVIGLLFVAGASLKGVASPGLPHAGTGKPSGFDNITITVTRDFAVAGVNQDSIKVNISPAPAPGEQIEFDWAGFGVLANVDAQGNAYFGVGAAAAGTLTVTIKRAGTVIGSTVLTFISTAGPVDPAKSYLEVIQNPALADGSSVDIVRAHLFDANGNMITASTPVVFDMQSGTANFTSPSSPAPGSGSAVGGTIDAKLVSAVVGSVVVHATAGGVSIANTVTVQFVSGPVDPTKSYLEVIQSPSAADGTSQDIVRAHLFDQYGHPLSDTAVSFAIVSGTASFSGASSGVTVGGTLDADLVSTVVGDVQVSATVKVNGVDVQIGSSPVTVKFVIGPPDNTNPETKLVVDIAAAPADGVTTTTLHAHIVDNQGRAIDYPLDNVTFFIVPGGTANATAVLSGGGGPITPTNGDVPLTITNTVPGTVTIGATYTYKGTVYTITFGSPATVTFTQNVPDPNNAQCQLIVDIPQAAADGTSITKIHAHLVNSAGHVPAGLLITMNFFIIPGGTANSTAVMTMPIGVNPITVPASGDIELDITNTKVGTVLLGANLTIVGTGTIITITNGSPAQVQFVAGQAVPTAPNAPSDPNAPGGTTGTQLSIVKDFAPADGTATDKVNAHITDANGNPVKDTTVTFSIMAGGTSTATAQLVGTVTVKTDANGNATMQITNTVAGTVWINASIIYNGNPAALIDGSYKEITFTNIPDVTNPETKLIVMVYEALADGQSTTVVKAHVVDQTGAVLPGQEVKFKVDSGNAQIITPGPWITDGNGDVSIELTSTKPGFVLVTATVNVSGVDKAITYGSPARVKFAAINIYVPKVFTPNGDGSNDVLKPILVGISQFHYFNVYNRWGNLVFTTQDPNRGWDGTFKGVPQPVETYLWIAEGIDINGKKIVAKGMTSLVK